MNVADELQKLQQLHQSGGISDEEYAKAKGNLLNPPSPGGPATPASIEQQTKQWAMFLHLSQLANFVAPLAGLIIPIVIWQIKKTDLPGIDQHGKIVINWIISAVLYWIGCFILMFLIVGIPLMLALAVIAIVFPIIGAVKANNGEAWKYPLSIPFFK
jgi:uncharacterized protein